jgi:hypothetical protein
MLNIRQNISSTRYWLKVHLMSNIFQDCLIFFFIRFLKQLILKYGKVIYNLISINIDLWIFNTLHKSEYHSNATF